jgi:hypothetical protein
MSEYQYYEFQAIDKPLTKAEQQEISLLSSRVQLSSTRAIFTYSYGDFPGNPEQVLVKYFDAMFYIANWGTIQLMFRFPKGLIDVERMQKYCIEDMIAISEINNFIILEILIWDEEGFGWIEGEGNLSSLIGLRQEILQGDYRLLYLAWLKGITCFEIDEAQLEPPVPPGLGKLSSPLQAFIDTCEVNEYLLKVATSASAAKPSISDNHLKEAIKKLDRSESDTFLLRLAKGEANLSFELRKKLSEMMEIIPDKSLGERTIGQLLESTEQEQEQNEQREKKADEASRVKELEVLGQRSTDVWKDVDNLIQKGTSKSYEEAVKLLLKLKDLADHQNQQPNFLTRMQQLHAQYRSRPALKRLLLQANL